MSFFKTLFSDPNKKVIQDLQTRAEKINQLESKFESFSDEEIKAQTQKFKQQLKAGKTLDNILEQAFAVVREAAKRTLKQRHYDVQMMGGITLHQGNIAEMKTGEGKTLASTTAIYLNALTGKGVHVITVNDYLAKRDTVWMGQIYNALGLSVACIGQLGSAFIYNESVGTEQCSVPTQNNDQERDEKGSFKIEEEFLQLCTRQEAYNADITYGTNSEFGFDYLRDNMALDISGCVQRSLEYAIIDEVDSILIDEARTPLIISAPDTKAAELYKKFAQLVPRLQENEDYNIDEKMHSSTLTEAGIKKMEKLLGVDNIYTEDPTLAHHLDQALKAHTLYKRDKEYVVKQGEIIIVDEFTGRLQPGRRFSQGLHQALEAKEEVEVKQESRTLATITIQNYFRMYKKLSGMTGTAATEAEEFHKIYNLDVTVIPPNRPLIRQDKPDLIFKNEQGKLKALAAEIKKRQEKGQPILVGTISIEKNELLGAFLEKQGIKYKLLNAKNHQKEAEIIAQAGRVRAVTIATNMAGRGVDIILGGSPLNPESAEQVKELGGLCVFGSERHESRRIDNQLRGRSGRQGDLGESQFFLSMEDDLMRIFGSDRMKGVMSRLGLPEDVPIQNKLITRSIEAAQKKVEGHNFDIRKHLLEYDDVLNTQRTAVYKKRRELLEMSSTQNRENPIDPCSLVKKEIENIVLFHTSDAKKENWNLQEITEAVNTIYPAPDLNLNKYESSQKIIEVLKSQSEKLYKEIEKSLQPENIRLLEKNLYLRIIDNLWMDHLDQMEYLRTGIGLRGYGQRDPLIEYKKEGHRMFQALLKEIDRQVVYTVFKAALNTQALQQNKSLLEQFQNIKMHGAEQVSALQRPSAGETQASFTTTQEQSKQTSYSQPIQKHPRDVSGKKIGRNDPCPCGSGKKFKKCCINKYE